MKFQLKSILLLFIMIYGSSCEKKEDPIIPHEEELITTLKYTLTSADSSVVKEFIFKDVDGDGGDEPVITIDTLDAHIAYTGRITLLNESESPAEDITVEVEEEGAEHQLFFISSGADMEITYLDVDENGNSLGLETLVLTDSISEGTLNIVLRHQPKKPNDGSLSDAGGSTDISVDFDVFIR